MNIMKHFFRAVIILPVFALAFGACPAPGTETKNTAGKAVVISGTDLTRLVPEPVNLNEIPAELDEQIRYTAEAKWESSINGRVFYEDYGEFFIEDTFYQVTVTLTAKDGYTFRGTVPDEFTHKSGTIMEINPDESGSTLSILIRFTKIPHKYDVTVSATNLTSVLPSPLKGSSPQVLIEDTQYNCRVSWQTLDGVPVTAFDTFAPATSYRAFILLNTNSGYTLNGLGKTGFSHSGAQEVSFDLGTSTVSVLFYPTVGANDDNPVNLYNLNSAVSVPAVRTTPSTQAIDTDQYSGTVQWFYEDNSPISGNITFEKPFKVIVTLTAKESFSFTGVPENAFFYSHGKLAGITNDAGSGTVTMLFSGLDWTPLASSIADVSPAISSGSGPANGASVRACCYYNSSTASPATLLTTNTSWYDWGYDNSNSANNLSSWPEIFKTPLGTNFLNDIECGPGHPAVFLQPSVPEEIRRYAHVLNLDLGSIRNNLVQIGFCSRDLQRFPYEFEVFYSDTDISPIDVSNAKSLGIFHNTNDVNTAGTWADFDVYLGSPGARAFQARYFQIRVYRTNNTAGPGDRIDLSFRQIRVRATSQPDS